MPWFFWVVWGLFGIPYILRWVIKFSKNDPMLWRIGWALSTVLLIIVIIDNVIKGTGALASYSAILGQISIPLVVLTVLLIFMGGYQKATRPDFDPEKRRTVKLYMYGLVATLILLGLFFGGFEIYHLITGR